MKAIRYIGTKGSKRDNVAGTGLSWAPNQIHVVSDERGVKLLDFPSVWEEVPAEQLAAESSNVGAILNPHDSVFDSGLSMPPIPAGPVPPIDAGRAQEPPKPEPDQPDQGTYKKDVPETPGAVHVDTPNLHGMTKDALIAYGQATFQTEMEMSMKKDDMVQRLVDLLAARAVRGNAQ